MRQPQRDCAPAIQNSHRRSSTKHALNAPWEISMQLTSVGKGLQTPYLTPLEIEVLDLITN